MPPYDENGPVAPAATEPDGATEAPMNEESTSDGDSAPADSSAASGE